MKKFFYELLGWGFLVLVVAAILCIFGFLFWLSHIRFCY